MRYRRKTSSCPSSFLRALCTRAHGSSRDDHEQPPDRRPHAGVFVWFQVASDDLFRTICFGPKGLRTHFRSTLSNALRRSPGTVFRRTLSSALRSRAPSSDARFQACSGQDVGRFFRGTLSKGASVKTLGAFSVARFLTRFGQGFRLRPLDTHLGERRAATGSFRGACWTASASSIQVRQGLELSQVWRVFTSSFL
jgi:hypothetical protein